MRHIRLFINGFFTKEEAIELEFSHTHYLCNVMRCKNHHLLRIFNGKQGEWLAELIIEKKRCLIIPQNCIQDQPSIKAEIALIQALIKRQEIVIEKATELGVTDIFPVKTDHSVGTNFNLKKANLWATEAAEQSERLTVPCIHPLGQLKSFLNTWPERKKIILALERGGSLPLQKIISSLSNDFAILIGPEGGFSDMEQNYLKNHPAVIPVSLGSTILRSETAAIVALALAIQGR